MKTSSQRKNDEQVIPIDVNDLPIEVREANEAFDFARMTMAET
jgi:hypothetical protein